MRKEKKRRRVEEKWKKKRGKEITMKKRPGHNGHVEEKWYNQSKAKKGK